MNQLNLDFNMDINKRFYTSQEIDQINFLISKYKSDRFKFSNEIIILKLFFEENCIEIINNLKEVKYFENDWSFNNIGLSRMFYEFIVSKKSLNESHLLEFIMSLFNSEEMHIQSFIWRDNDTTKFEFDRKITEFFIELIADDNLDKIIPPYMGYLKIWNYYNIYNKPFNNFKASLINRLLADSLWPKKNISYNKFSAFESIIKSILRNNQIKIKYLPFFDQETMEYYSQPYLKSRALLASSLTNLFDYDNTDEGESYSSLIFQLMNNQTGIIEDRQKELIELKIKKLMCPTYNDVNMFCKLYKDFKYKDYGKWLLSKFYLYNKIDI